MRPTLVFLAFLAASFAAAAIGGIATAPGVRDWYPSLNKPTWNPPAWLFGPMWTFLYLCIAVAGFLVWKKAGIDGAKWTLLLFTLQLILNAAWSWIFFGMRQPGWGFAEIIVLWIIILATAIAFFRLSPTAGMLFMPYLLWVTFAGVLNGTIWRLNP